VRGENREECSREKMTYDVLTGRFRNSMQLAEEIYEDADLMYLLL